MKRFGKFALMLTVATVAGFGALGAGAGAARADDDGYDRYDRPQVQCDWDGDDCRYVRPEHTYRTECDWDGDDCRQLVCDQDGDRRRPVEDRWERHAYRHEGWW